LSTNIFQGRVATSLMCGGMFHHGFTRNLLLNLLVKELWKSINAWQSQR